MAWIGFAGGVIAAIISAFVAVRQARGDERQGALRRELDERLARLNHDFDERLAKLDADLQTEVHERNALIDRDIDAEAVLARYRQPLAAAAYDLQSRLYNILSMDFFAKHGVNTPRADEAFMTTLFRFAQYLGWTEILRRDIQFLSFPKEDETKDVARLQFTIARCLLTDDYGHAMMIWNDQQRAIGERMIVEEHGKVLCMGYGRFRSCCDETFREWSERIRAEILDPEAQPRLRDLQHLLCQLVKKLDTEGLRDEDLELAR